MTQDYVTSVLAVGLGLVGIGVAWMLYGSRKWAVPRLPAVQRTLEHKFWFDELYDAIFYTPAVFVSRLLRKGIEKPLIGGSISGVTLGAREAGGAVGEAQTGYLRSYALGDRRCCCRAHRRLHHRPVTTALIILPLAAALVVWLLPLPGRAAGGLALLAALAEVALWAVALGGFDFEQGLQLEDRQSWFSDLGVSYHVGFYGFSLWLAGLTVVVSAAAIGYALWVDRERGRAYHGLLLFLTGSIVGVFTAQDLLLFYVFFEAMLIPHLRPDRRVGRSRARCGRPPPSSSTRWPARC